MEYIRGDIVFVNRRDGVGCEQQGDRPAVIVSNDIGNHFSPLVEIVWLTTAKRHYMPTHCHIESALKPSTALCECVTTIDKCRIDRIVGHCTKDEMQMINKAIAISLALDE